MTDPDPDSDPDADSGPDPDDGSDPDGGTGAGADGDPPDADRRPEPAADDRTDRGDHADGTGGTDHADGAGTGDDDTSDDTGEDAGAGDGIGAGGVDADPSGSPGGGGDGGDDDGDEPELRTTTAEAVPGGIRDVGMIVATVLALGVVYALVASQITSGPNGIAGTLQSVFFFAMVYALVALALNLHWGYAGMFNIGVIGFMAVGVYVTAIATRPTNPAIDIPTTPPGLGLPLWAGMLLGVTAAAAVGALVALPALRLRADYFAIVTVAFSEIVRLTANAQPFQEFSVVGVRIGTGAASGLSIADSPKRAVTSWLLTNPDSIGSDPTGLGAELFALSDSFGVRRTVAIDLVYVLVLAAFVALFYVLLRRVGNSPFGRVLKAIREDEDVARALGKDTRRFKIKAFALGCGLMGLAGILWQGTQGTVNPNSFRPITTFYLWVALVVGGAGSNTGSVLGGLLFATLLFQGPVYVKRLVQNARPGTVTAELIEVVDAVGPAAVDPAVGYALDNISALRFMLLGVVLVAVMQRRPEGLLGHRKEVAAGVELGRTAPPDDPGSGSRPATDGGPRGEGRE